MEKNGPNFSNFERKKIFQICITGSSRLPKVWKDA
jgi:hypothetical protein